MKELFLVLIILLLNAILYYQVETHKCICEIKESSIINNHKADNLVMANEASSQAVGNAR